MIITYFYFSEQDTNKRIFGVAQYSDELYIILCTLHIVAIL